MVKLLLLLAALVASTLFPNAAFADNEPPGSPGDLRGSRYSTTTGEIRWSPARDNVIVVGYKVYRDGQYLGLKDARSLYESKLTPGRTYTYLVNAVDRAGNEGPVFQVEISGKNGVTTQGRAADTSAKPESTGAESTGSTNDAGLKLVATRDRLSVVEGDSAGVSIGVSVSRLKSRKRAVTLSLESSDRDVQGLRYVFSKRVLPVGESGTVLIIKLDVTVAPLLSHERSLRIVADDGVSRDETSITLDVTPTAAPDVYLLIGQSNMEGYSEPGSREPFPGGKDERNERIRQLNVQPNNASIFSRNALFTSESANVRPPRFVIAEDPLHEPRYISVDGKGASFVGLGLTFAKSALNTTTADIYLVPAAWGATGFCANSNGKLAWNAAPTKSSYLGGTLLTDRALTRLNMTLRETGGVLRGILWHQGGADSNNADCAKSYADNLSKLVKRLRREARPDRRGSSARGDNAEIPFIVATQSKGDDSRAKFSVFNSSKRIVDSAHRSVSGYINFSGFVNNDDLVPPAYPCGQVSCVHFGATALREQGRRFYVALEDIWSEMKAFHF